MSQLRQAHCVQRLHLHASNELLGMLLAAVQNSWISHIARSNTSLPTAERRVFLEIGVFGTINNGIFQSDFLLRYAARCPLTFRCRK